MGWVLTLPFSCSSCTRPHRSSRPIAVHSSILPIPCIALNQLILSMLFFHMFACTVYPELRGEPRSVYTADPGLSRPGRGPVGEPRSAKLQPRPAPACPCPPWQPPDEAWEPRLPRASREVRPRRASRALSPPPLFCHLHSAPLLSLAAHERELRSFTHKLRTNLFVCHTCAKTGGRGVVT